MSQLPREVGAKKKHPILAPWCHLIIQLILGGPDIWQGTWAPTLTKAVTGGTSSKRSDNSVSKRGQGNIDSSKQPTLQAILEDSQVARVGAKTLMSWMDCRHPNPSDSIVG